VKGKIFSKVGEKEVTRAIVNGFAKQFSDYVESDCIIVGAGPSGLMAGSVIAENGKKVIIIERNNYLGGGFWLGGYLMNMITVREPGQKMLDTIGVPYRKAGKFLYLADGPHACSKLIAYACDKGVKFANMTSVDDIVLRKNNRVSGVVINWTPIEHLPRGLACVDPVAIETKVVIDATGHDAVVVRKLEKRGLIKMKGEGAMWIEKSEDLVVEHTGQVHPGLIVCGMSVAATYGLPRMGPTFGAMLLSGEKAGKLALENMS